MRIAVVTRYFPSSAEPAQGRSLYETLRIVARSAEVRVFFPNASYPALLRPRSRMYARLDPSFRPPEVDVRYFDYPALPLLSRPFNGWMAARTLLPHVRQFAPDLILGVFLYPESFAAIRIGRALGVPVVAKSIGSDLNRIGGPISARFTRAVLHQADAIVTVSDDLRRKAVAMGAPALRTQTIHNGCDLSVFHPDDRSKARLRLGLNPESKIVVYVGRIDLKKGLRELVQAAARLRAVRSALQVYLVGSGPDKASIESTILACGAADSIHLVPSCAFDEVAVWMAAADVVTLPSYMEGCPNVVLEALACGRPVVATNVGGIPEILNDTCGVLVPPYDSGKLADALGTALDAPWDPAVTAAQGSRSWSAPAAELLEIFDALVLSKSRLSTIG